MVERAPQGKRGEEGDNGEYCMLMTKLKQNCFQEKVLYTVTYITQKNVFISSFEASFSLDSKQDCFGPEKK